MNEFDLIGRLFVPLAESFSGSLRLGDDAALLDIPEGMQLVVTKDAISEGVHFIGNEDPAHIAQKLLRTNLSDLAAMGANPLCYFLSIAMPTLDEAFIKRFCEGLAADQQSFHIALAGGDTIRTQGSKTFTITAHGLVPQGTALLRSGAQAGDVLYSSGTLGDAALGLRCLEGTLARHSFLEDRYLLPQPRLALGQALHGIATACMDISDGLLQDVGHLCKASNVSAQIHKEKLPLSPAARAFVEADASLWPLIYSGGDDYELLFTLPATIIPNPEWNITAIGTMTTGSGVALFDNGTDITPERVGYSH